jgi:hypothetical protein
MALFYHGTKDTLMGIDDSETLEFYSLRQGREFA